MPKSITHTYSRYSRDALALLGVLVQKSVRKERKLITQEVADRAGIS